MHWLAWYPWSHRKISSTPRLPPPWGNIHFGEKSPLMLKRSSSLLFSSSSIGLSGEATHLGRRGPGRCTAHQNLLENSERPPGSWVREKGASWRVTSGGRKGREREWGGRSLKTSAPSLRALQRPRARERRCSANQREGRPRAQEDRRFAVHGPWLGSPHPGAHTCPRGGAAAGRPPPACAQSPGFPSL